MTTQSLASPQLFDFNSNLVRVFLEEDGAPWFVAGDVCKILNYSNAPQTVSDHCRRGGISKRYTTSCDVSNRDATSSARHTQEVTVIDEGNLYRLIIKSHKPEARAFESWVCDEVLPSIRKTGKYEAPKLDRDDYADFPPPLSPFDRIHPGKLADLRRLNRGAATAYLIDCGVTPEYVHALLTQNNATGFTTLPSSVAEAGGESAPLDHLAREIPMQADASDDRHYYLTRESLLRICGDYDVRATLSRLRHLGYLRCYHGQFQTRGPRPLFSDKRVNVYAVRKTILKEAGSHV